MCTSGNGTWPKNALRASQSSTVLSLPIDHSMPRLLEVGVRLPEDVHALVFQLIEMVHRLPHWK